MGGVRKMTLQGLEDPELVITRNPVLPSCEIRFRFMQRIAEHSAPTLIEIDLVRIQVPFPQSQVRHFQCQVLSALPQEPFFLESFALPYLIFEKGLCLQQLGSPLLH